MDDARRILGPAFRYAVHGALRYGECPVCGKTEVETVIRDLWLDAQGKILIDGWCRSCKFKLLRTIDTQEYPDAYDLAMGLRKLRTGDLQDK